MLPVLQLTDYVILSVILLRMCEKYRILLVIGNFSVPADQTVADRV